MAKEGTRRKLTAILSADVKGYSRLMGDDEAATVRTITAHRKEMAVLVESHNGRIVDATGDNVLAEFPSVVDAVLCAVEIQKELRVKNADLPEHRRMAFRIGINLGDVIEEEGAIYGDGVNIAARLEGLAPGGGICISGTVYDHVKNKGSLAYEFLGEQNVKNIKEPVRVYKIRMEEEVPSPEPEEKTGMPDRISIAVLPFDNLSGNPEQEYFSDGLTEEIITALSKISKVFVIARNSSFTYKGKPVKVQQVGEELGVGYVLEGSVRQAGKRVRITAQLVDSHTGHHLWADRYDRDLDDIFALQDEMTIKILTALQVTLTEGEQARLYDRSTCSLDSFMKLLEGNSFFFQFNEDDNAIARKMFEESISLDPENANAYAMNGWTYVMDLWYGSSASAEKSIARALELGQKALALDQIHGQARSLLGYIYLMMRQHEKAAEEAKRAVELNPNGADAHAHLAQVLTYIGQEEEAIALLKRAMRLNPMPPNWYLLNLALVYRRTGQYEKAMANSRKVLERNPDDLLAHIGLMADYILTGQDREAREEAQEVLRINPRFSLDGFAKTMPYKDQADTDLAIEVFRKAGLK